MRVTVFETTLCFGYCFRYYLFDAETGRHVDTYDALAHNKEEAREEFNEYAKGMFEFEHIEE